MRTRLLSCSTLALLILFSGLAPAAAQDRAPAVPSRLRGEPAPTFRASELLHKDLLRGENYDIDETVPVRDYNFLFTLRTDYGTIPALGRNMLELRLREMRAITLAIQHSGDPQFVQGLYNSIRRTPQGAILVLSDPVGTIYRLPEGLKMTVENHLNAVDRRAGSPARRRLAVEIGCDPETNNPILQRLLDNIALRKGAGELTVKAGLGFALPGLGLLPTTVEFKDLIALKLPHEINAEIEQELRAMGVAEQVCATFCRGVNYTTTQRLLLMQFLRQFQGVEHRTLLLARAIQVRNEAEGLSMIHQMKLLAEIHKDRPIARLVENRLLVAMLADGRRVIVSALDYRHDTEEFQAEAAYFRQTIPQGPAVFVTAGYLSQAAKARLASLDVTVVEAGAIERVTKEPAEGTQDNR